LAQQLHFSPEALLDMDVKLVAFWSTALGEVLRRQRAAQEEALNER